MEQFGLRRVDTYIRYAEESGSDAIDWLREDADPTNPDVLPYADWAAQSAKSAAHWAHKALDAMSYGGQ